MLAARSEVPDAGDVIRATDQQGDSRGPELSEHHCLVEGSAKRTMAEYRAYLDHASGLLNEVEYYIHLSCRLGYIDGKTAQHLFALEAEAARTLNGLITAIEKQIAGGRKLNRLPAA